MPTKKKKFAKKDKEILNSYRPIVKSISAIFGSSCEVVLHSLENADRSIIQIENGHITGRKVGAPLTDLKRIFLNTYHEHKRTTVEPHFTERADGKVLKSVSSVILNDESMPIGFLSINVDISAPAMSFFQEFFSKETDDRAMEEHFPKNIDDVVIKSIDDVNREINMQRGLSPREKSKLIVEGLYRKRVFNVKGAVDLVARELKVSRYTIYNYLTEIKAKIREAERNDERDNNRSGT